MFNNKTLIVAVLIHEKERLKKNKSRDVVHDYNTEFIPVKCRDCCIC